MKICIDGIGISMLKGTGLYSYTYEILNNLFEMYPQPEYEVICDKEINIKEWEKNEKVFWLNLNLNRGENDNELLLNHLYENKINLYHSINNGFSTPQRKSKGDMCKYVCTVHDVIAASNSELVDDKYLNKFQRVFPGVLASTDGIVAVSEFIKNEIIKYYGIDERKIRVIYPGCGERFRPIEYEECSKYLKKEYNIDGNMILYSGSIHKRKNLHRLLYIFKDILKYDNNIKLVIVGKNNGKRSDYYNELKKLAGVLKIDDKVYFTGTVEYSEMPYFYNAAKCVVNLSEYEGFPMTSVEALCCGTPVICSNSTSFKEIIKHEGKLIYTDNEKQIGDTILDVINDRSYKEEVVKNSKIIKERYNWQKAIRKYVSLYESLTM